MNTLKRVSLAALLIISSQSGVFAQDGSNDPTFNPTDIGFGNGDGADAKVFCTALQPDGKLLFAGQFSHYNSMARGYIARTNADGSLDASFTTGLGANGDVLCMTLQPDGKIIIGGGFTAYNGTTSPYIARLNTDGTLDASFDPGLGAGNDVLCTTLQSDGKIIIGGLFTNYDETPRNYLARLNADGSLDASFDPGSAADGWVYSASLQTNGKMIVGGAFSSFNGTPRSRIARLNTDGSLDPSFDPGPGANDLIRSTSVQLDGRILIGGDFTSFNAIPRGRVARLNANGTLDATFDAASGADDRVNCTTLQPDGKVILAGNFVSCNGSPHNRIARLNGDGSLDTAFDPGEGADHPVSSVLLQPDGRVIIGGQFTFYNNFPRGKITRLNVDGDLDLSFNPGRGVNRLVAAEVFSTLMQPDGMIIIGGQFSGYNNAPRSNIARLNADGELDPSFDPGPTQNAQGTTGTILSMVLQPDGKIIIGGDFYDYAQIGYYYIARLNADGSLDTSFVTVPEVDGHVACTSLQPDGKVIIGGEFEKGIGRLLTNGGLDPSFDPGTGIDGPYPGIYSTSLQPDGKIVVGGAFTSYNGTPRTGVVRLNTDGSLDAIFNPVVGADHRVLATAMQPDGKIIIGGHFQLCNGVPRQNIARLNTDGSLDTAFDPGYGPDDWVLSIEILPDGKIIIGGYFDNFSGTSRKNIARLNADGSLDSSFDPGTGTGGLGLTTIRSTTWAGDGQLIIGGAFTSYDGTGRNRVARIMNALGTVVRETNDGASAVLFPNPTNGAVCMSGVKGSARVDVIDAMGHVVLSRNFVESVGKPIDLDIPAPCAGSYTVKLRDASGIKTYKLVVY